jgi:hypothetical protein
MPDSEVQINFDVPATLRKWPSVNNERVSASLGARPYPIIDGPLDECIRKFVSQPRSQRHPTALKAGATRIEILEILVQIGFGAGLPTSIDALQAVAEVFLRLTPSAQLKHPPAYERPLCATSGHSGKPTKRCSDCA